jgi:hypothetical protein
MNSPLEQELKVEVGVGETESLLEGSIIHNLEGGKAVRCYFLKGMTERNVVCKGVKQLLNTKTYFIGFRCAFLSTASNT